MQMSLPLTFGSEDSHAKMSRWRAWGRAQGLKENVLDSFMSMLGSLESACPEWLSSKTFRASSLVMVDETSNSLFTRWPNSGMAWDGVCLTASTSESPNHANESILLDVIETGEVPLRYFLSPNAAVGMMRRADRMGRSLFPPLRKSLEILSKVQSSKDLPIASTPVQRVTPAPIGAGPMLLIPMDEYDG